MFQCLVACLLCLQIGPNGYYFAIDPNGYVLLHPNLQPKVSAAPKLPRSFCSGSKKTIRHLKTSVTSSIVPRELIGIKLWEEEGRPPQSWQWTSIHVYQWATAQRSFCLLFCCIERRSERHSVPLLQPTASLCLPFGPQLHLVHFWRGSTCLWAPQFNKRLWIKHIR